jgi:Family of unknown function (DUF5329)
VSLRLITFALVIAGLLCLQPAFAQPVKTAQAEINYLLDFVEISGCEFYRNGSWYDSVQAQEHLHTKYEFFLTRDRIVTAEDFIALAASESSFSGIAYEIRCGTGCAAITTREWLLGVLARYRQVMGRGSEPP